MCLNDKVLVSLLGGSNQLLLTQIKDAITYLTRLHVASLKYKILHTSLYLYLVTISQAHSLQVVTYYAAWCLNEQAVSCDVRRTSVCPQTTCSWTWAACCDCQEITAVFLLIRHLPTGGVHKNSLVSSFDKLCFYWFCRRWGDKRLHSSALVKGRGNDTQRLCCDLISLLKQSFAMQQIGGRKVKSCGSFEGNCCCRVIFSKCNSAKDQTVTLDFALSFLAGA